MRARTKYTYVHKIKKVKTDDIKYTQAKRKYGKLPKYFWDAP